MMHHRRTASDTATALFNRPSAELKKEGPSSSHSSRSATPLIASFLRTQEAPPPPSSAPAIQMSPQQQPSKQQAQQSQSQSQQHQPTQVQCTCAIGSSNTSLHRYSVLVLLVVATPAYTGTVYMYLCY